MKKTTLPSALALLIISSLFVLAFFATADAQSHEMRGHRLYLKANYNKAIKQFEKVSAEDMSSQARLRLADAYRRTGQPALAEEQYLLATYIPEGEHYHLAQVLVENGNYDGANRLIRLNLDAHPEDARFQDLMAQNEARAAVRPGETSPRVAEKGRP